MTIELCYPLNVEHSGKMFIWASIEWLRRILPILIRFAHADELVPVHSIANFRSKHLHCVECFRRTHVQMKSVRYASLRSLLLFCRGNQKLTNWLAALFHGKRKTMRLLCVRVYVPSLAKCVCTSNQHEFSDKYFRKQFHTWTHDYRIPSLGLPQIFIVECRRTAFLLFANKMETHSNAKTNSFFSVKPSSQRDMFGKRREDGCVKMKSVWDENEVIREFGIVN